MSQKKKILYIVIAVLALFTSCGVGAAMGGADTTAAAGDAAASATATVTQTAKSTVTETASASTPAPETMTSTATKTLTATKTRTKTVTKTAKPKPAQSKITDGTYLVGSEIKPGVYKSSGGQTMMCYADTETRGGDILEQEVADKGSVIIRVTSKAYTFTSQDCGSWKKVG